MRNLRFGFTAIEIVIVVAVMALLSTLTWAAFSGLNESQIVEKEAMTIVSALEEARSLTLASRNASQYGVRLDAHQIIIFQGSSYDPSNTANKVIDLNSRVGITSTILSGGGPDVVFERLSGATANFGTTTVTLTSKPSKYKNVIIFGTGLSQIK